MSQQPATMTAEQLVHVGVSAYHAQDRMRAFEALSAALMLNPRHEVAWLWLSGVVLGHEERRYCLERVLEINPEHTAARRALERFPADLVARPPFALPEPPAASTVGRCTHPDCQESVSRPGHTLCLAHWKATQKQIRERPVELAGNLLSASVIGERLGISNRLVNAALVELGWINKGKNGYAPTAHGQALGGSGQTHRRDGVAYVVWPEQILAHQALHEVVRALSDEGAKPVVPSQSSERSFREKFPATYRTADGHMVRSRAEVVIDNWLYTNTVMHAYERRLPIEEELYCDFYLPTGKVYIEYWGRERDPKYAARQQIKREIYQKYGLNLLEIDDEILRMVDDHLPRLLLVYGVVIA